MATQIGFVARNVNTTHFATFIASADTYTKQLLRTAFRNQGKILGYSSPGINSQPYTADTVNMPPGATGNLGAILQWIVSVIPDIEDDLEEGVSEARIATFLRMWATAEA